MPHIGANLFAPDPSVLTEHWGQPATGCSHESALNQSFRFLGAVNGEGLPMNILKGAKPSDSYLSADQNCP
jgi:hypothetical protein